MKKKIAILANFPIELYKKNIGHISAHISPWLRALHVAFEAFSEYEFHWIVPCKFVAKELIFVEKKQFFHIVPRARRMIGLFTAYTWDRFIISRCVKKINPDILHAWGTEDCFGLCALDYRGRKLLSVQGLLQAYAQRAKIVWFEKYQSKYESKVFRALPYFTTESQWAKERVLEISPKANIKLWDYAVEERFFQVERCISSDPCCLLAGTNSPVKNVGLAIRAFSRPELRNVKLYLAGVSKDSYPDIPDNIIPLGRVGRDEIVELLRKAWCLVHPSLADTGPTILKEARVMGVPAVVTTDCGAKQYIVPGKSGFVVTPNSEEELVNAVLYMTKDAETAKEMGEFDRERCRVALSSETMIRELRTIYQNILRD